MTDYTVLTNLKVTDHLQAADLTLTDDLIVADDASVGGDLAVTGEIAGVEKWYKLGQVVFGATSAAAVTIFTLAKDHILTEVMCHVETAFNSGTSDSLVLGTTADELMAANDITEGTIGIYRKAAALVGGASGTAIKATLTKEGTAATAGKATFYGKILKTKV